VGIKERKKIMYTHHIENHQRKTIVIPVSAQTTGAQSGKDTFAGIFEEQMSKLKKKVWVTHLADPLKLMAKNIYKWDGNKDEYGRGLLQYLGTDKVRKMRPDYWVEHILGQLDLIDGDIDYVVIPDARFPNEIDAFKKAGYKTINVDIQRPGYDNGLTEEQRNHPSETALRGYPADVVILNDGTLEDYSIEIAKLVEKLMKGEI
jgi:hypothetical protein